MTRPPAGHDTISQASGPRFRDGLGTRVRAADAGGDPVEHLHLVADLTPHETAIRERVGRLINFRHARYVRLRGVERARSGARELIVAYDALDGVRLSTVLETLPQLRISFDVDIALQIVRDLLPAIGILHDSRKVTHGAIAPERLVFTSQQRLVIVDHGLGTALGRLNLQRKKLWEQYRIAVPGANRGVFDERTDVLQIGLVALALLLARPLTDDEYPGTLKRLVLTLKEVSSKTGPRPIGPELRRWLERALGLDEAQTFATVKDAQDCFEAVIASGRYAPSAAIVKAFFLRYQELAPQPVAAEPAALDEPKLGAAVEFKPAAGSARPEEPAKPPSRAGQPIDALKTLEAELSRLTGDEVPPSGSATSARELEATEAGLEAQAPTVILPVQPVEVTAFERTANDIYADAEALRHAQVQAEQRAEASDERAAQAMQGQELAERAARDASVREQAERGAREAAEQQARDAHQRMTREQAEREAAERAAREAAARESAERQARERAEQQAREAAERAQQAEQAARLQAQREAEDRKAREDAARDEAERHAAERRAREEATREAARRERTEREARERAEREAQQAAERAAKEQAAREAAERLAAEQAVRLQAEREAAARAAAEHAARVQAERDDAARLAAEEAARLRAERDAAERTAREAAERARRERAAREQAEREAAAHAASLQAEREAAARAKAEEAARLQAERAALERQAAARAAEEAARKAAAEREARERAEQQARAAAEQAARQAAERESAEREARKAAERARREAAERELAERAAMEAASRASREAAERVAAEKQARELAARAEAERLARASAEREARDAAVRAEQERQAREAAERAARDAAARADAERQARAEAEARAREAAEQALRDAAQLAREAEAAAKAAARQVEEERQARAAAEARAREAAEQAAREQAGREALLAQQITRETITPAPAIAEPKRRRRAQRRNPLADTKSLTPNPEILPEPVAAATPAPSPPNQPEIVEWVPTLVVEAVPAWARGGSADPVPAPEPAAAEMVTIVAPPVMQSDAGLERYTITPSAEAASPAPWPGAPSTPLVAADGETADEPAAAAVIPFRPRRRFHVNWARTLAASLLVALLEGVAFAAAWWYVTPNEQGWLTVHTRPTGIQIAVDGRPLGPTPLATALSPGRHTIELRHGTATRVVPVEISPGVQTEQRIAWGLGFRTGQARISASTEGARVLIDGRERGRTPLTVTELAAGRHEVTVETEKGTVTTILMIEPGETTELDVPVFSGWVSILSPVALDILLDGKLLGTTDVEKLMLAPGRHTLELRNASLGYRERQEVQVRPGATTSVSVLPRTAVSVEGPEGAELWVDGDRLGVLPLAKVAVAIGTREFVLKRHGEDDSRQIVVVTMTTPVALKF